MKIDCDKHDKDTWDCYQDSDGYIYHLKKVCTHEELMAYPVRDALFRLNRAQERVNTILNSKK